MTKQAKTPAYVLEDAMRLAQRPEIRKWAADMFFEKGVDWLDFDAACHVRGFAGAGKTSAALFVILYGLEPYINDSRLDFRKPGAEAQS